MKPFLIALLCLALLVLPAGPIPSSASPTIPKYHPIRTIQRTDVWNYWAYPEEFAFSPDGHLFAAAISSNTVNIWDVDTGAVVRTLVHGDPLQQNILAVSWSPDGTLITTAGSQDGGIRVWDASSGALWSEGGAGRYVAWSPDSTRFVTDCQAIFSAQTGDRLVQLDPYFIGYTAAYWSPDGSLIALGADDTDYGAYLNLWTADGKLLDTYSGNGSASWSPDSTRLASYGEVRDVSTGLPVTIIPQMGGSIAWHPHEEWIASTGNGHQISFWDAQTGDLLTAWHISGCYVGDFAWSADGERFAVNCVQETAPYRNDLIIMERTP